MPESPGSRTAFPVVRVALAFLAAALFLWWLLEGFLPPPSPEPARLRGDSVEAGEPPGLLLLPLEAVASEAEAGTAGRVHALLLEGLREQGVRVAAGDASAPPGSGRRGGTGVEGVEAVLAGDLVEDGDRIRLSLRLLAAPSGELLWSGSYEGRSQAAGELASTAARSVAAELALWMEVLRSEPPEDPSP